MRKVLITNINSPVSSSIVFSLRKENELYGIYNPARNVEYFLKSKSFHGIIELVPPLFNWITCNIKDELSESEIRYFNSILEYCKKIGINVIFPSYSDTDLFLFSKLKKKFCENNIDVVCPNFANWVSLSDKWLSIQEIKNVGIPVPKTILCSNIEEAKGAALNLGYPIVIKSRFSSGSTGVCLADNETELVKNCKSLKKNGKDVVIQEYISGGQHISVNFLITESDSLFFGIEKYRFLNPSASTAIKLYATDLFNTELIALAKKHKLNGLFCVMQLKYDEKSCKYMFIELNLRMGFNSRIVQSYVDIPTCILANQYNSSHFSFKNYKLGLGVSVIEDLYCISDQIATYWKQRKYIQLIKYICNAIVFYVKLPRLDINFLGFFSDFWLSLGYYNSIKDILKISKRELIDYENSKRL